MKQNTNTMTLTKEQMKIARSECRKAGINPKLVTSFIGDGFWADKCGSSFEGYLANITTPYVSDGSLDRMLLQSKIDYANRLAGASKLRR